MKKKILAIIICTTIVLAACAYPSAKEVYASKESKESTDVQNVPVTAEAAEAGTADQNRLNEVTRQVEELTRRLDEIKKAQDDSMNEAADDAVKTEAQTILEGKTLSILGDSISAFEGSTPEGYTTVYPDEHITEVDQMWWKQVLDKTGMELMANASFAGSNLTGNSKENKHADAGCSTRRIADLGGVEKGHPDIIIIYIGINDFAGNTPLGDYNGTGEVLQEGEMETFSDAYAQMLKKILTAYRGSRVYCATLVETARGDVDNPNIYPAINANGDSILDFNNRIKDIANAFGVSVIDLHSSGINFWNTDYYTSDKIHPNAEGSKLLANKVYNVLMTDFYMVE